MVRKDDLDFLKVLDERLHLSEIVYCDDNSGGLGNRVLHHDFKEEKITADEIEKLKEIVERNSDLVFNLSTFAEFMPAYDILEIRSTFSPITTTNYLLRFCQRQLPDEIRHQDLYDWVTKNEKNMSRLEFAGIEIRDRFSYYY